MKSMAQIHSEILSKARFDGGYPRVVVMGLGVIALANNEDEFNRLQKKSGIAHAVLGVGLLAVLISFIAVVAWEMLK